MTERSDGIAGDLAGGVQRDPKAPGPVAPDAHHAARQASALNSRILLQVGDVCAVLLPLALMLLIGVGLAAADTGIFGAAVLLWVGLRGLYRTRLVASASAELRRLGQALGLGALTTVGIAWLREAQVGRVALLVTAAVVGASLVLSRLAWRGWFGRQRASGELVRPAVLVGANPEADEFASMLSSDLSLGYRVVARVDPTIDDRAELLTTRVLRAVGEDGANTALIASSGVEMAALNRLCRDLVEAGVHVELSTALADIAPRRLTMRPLGRFPVAYLEPVERGGWRAGAKRTFDLISSSLAVILLAPLMLLIAIAIKVGTDGPVFFRQERVGRDGKRFEMLKFRTMVDGAHEQREQLEEQAGAKGPLFKMKSDPRVTKVGRLLRRTSLDELPQFINVVAGQMSLVGPRPALPSEMADWPPELYGRLRVRPGITGMWQVSGRSDTTFDEYIRHDLYYVDNWSLGVDIAILARTAGAVMRSDGAY